MKPAGKAEREPRRIGLELDGRGPGLCNVLDFGPPGAPAALIFLHANGFNALTYRAILGPASEGRRILAPDQRGHGATSLPAAGAGRTDWLDLRDDLIALLERLETRPIVVAGHSLGASVGILAAAAAPRRVRGLVLFDPVAAAGAQRSDMILAARRRRAVFESRAAAAVAYRGRGAFRSWPERMLADYVEAGFVDLPDGAVRLACEPAWEASNYAAQAHDMAGALRATTCPIRILKAERDSTWGLGDDAAALRPPGAGLTIETVPGTTHFLPMERPRLARAALAAAMDEAAQAVA